MAGGPSFAFFAKGGHSNDLKKERESQPHVGVVAEGLELTTSAELCSAGQPMAAVPT